MSNTALLAAIRRFGYYRKITGHGFRSLAVSTIKKNLVISMKLLTGS